MRWRRNPQVLWRTAPGYLVLAGLDGDAMEIEGPGSDVWARLEHGMAEEELISALARAYAADPATVSGDVRPLLSELLGRGFVERDG